MPRRGQTCAAKAGYTGPLLPAVITPSTWYWWLLGAVAVRATDDAASRATAQPPHRLRCVWAHRDRF
jgi:hypothetical protein